MWLTFLLGAIAVPERASDKHSLSIPGVRQCGPNEVLSSVALEVIALR